MLLLSHQKDNAIGEGKTEKSKKKKKKKSLKFLGMGLLVIITRDRKMQKTLDYLFIIPMTIE